MLFFHALERVFYTWSMYSMYFLTTKNNTWLTSGLTCKKILPNLPTDSAHAFLELSNLSSRGRGHLHFLSWSGTLFRKWPTTLPAEVFTELTVLSALSCQVFLKSSGNSYTISPSLAIITSWQLANVFGWKHHYSDPKLTAEETLRIGALSTNCLYLFATIDARTCWVNAASTFSWCAAHGDAGNDLLEMSFGRVVTLALSGSLEHLKITGCSVVRRLVLAW